MQAELMASNLKSLGDADLDSSSGSDDGPTVDNPPLYRRLRGLIMEKQMADIVLRYGVPNEFVCRLPSDDKSISCASPIELFVCDETFKAGFCLLLNPFIKCLLARYGLIPVQLHLNAWRGIINFIIKCAKVGLELRMRVLRSVLFLKAGLIGKSVIYSYYKISGLTPLVFELLHRWSNNFFFIRLSSGLWAFRHV